MKFEVQKRFEVFLIPSRIFTKMMSLLFAKTFFVICIDRQGKMVILQMFIDQ